MRWSCCLERRCTSPISRFAELLSLAGSGLMSLISDMANQLVPWVLRRCSGFCPWFALSLLAAGLIAVFFMLLRSLLTGRKPGPGDGLVTLPRRFTGEFRTLTNRTKPQVAPGSSGAPTARVRGRHRPMSRM
jgi:hypothetical protein